MLLMTRIRVVTRYRILRITRAWILGAVARSNQSPDKLQVPAHVFLHRRRAFGFELSPPVEADIGQASFYSCNDPRLHYGLGTSNSVDIEVFWPNGLHETFKAVGANQLVTLREGVGIVPSKGWVKG